MAVTIKSKKEIELMREAGKTGMIKDYRVYLKMTPFKI